MRRDRDTLDREGKGTDGERYRTYSKQMDGQAQNRYIP
jgi:hypothetical protein